jgi:Protein of unknown function (DUF3455)
MIARLGLITAAAAWATGALAQQQVPGALVAPGQTILAAYHAEGAQIYECTPAADGKLGWIFREPIATLLLNGKTAGRHYAGPTWELADGGAVVGKASANAPGATANDIPWLKLDVVDRRGNGLLERSSTVQRLNTRGGVLQGPCEQAGSFRSVAYSADYTFLTK